MTQATGGPIMVVMAAGIGRRYGGLKQIEPVGPNGEWIVDYSVFDALRAGFDRIVFVVREELEGTLRARFDGALADRCEVDYVHQRVDDLPAGHVRPVDRVKPWGTGHAILACRGLLGGPFAVINADDFYGRSGYELLAGFLGGTGDDHALVAYPLDETMTEHGTVSRGICRLGEDGTLDSIVERKRVAFRNGGIAYTEDGVDWVPIAEGAIASMNMWGFASGILDELEDRFTAFLADEPSADDEFFIPEVVGDLVAEGRTRVHVLQSCDPWLGVTYKADLVRARSGIARLIEAGAYPARLWEDR